MQLLWKRLNHSVDVRCDYFKHLRELLTIRRELKNSTHGAQMIAIQRLESLGDIVAVEPIVRYLRAQYPNAHVTWCVKKPFRELVNANPHVDYTLVTRCPTEWRLLQRSGIFDIMFDLQTSNPNCSLCLPTIKGKRKNIQPRTDGMRGWILARACEQAELPILQEQPDVYIEAAVTVRVDEIKLPDNFVAINGLSSDSAKDWTVEKWRALVEHIIRRFQLDIVEVGLTPVVLGLSSPRYRNLCGTPIMDMAEIIRRSQLFVGMDSGPAHLANALCRPGVILFGRKNPELPYKRGNPYCGYYANSQHAELIFGDASARDIPLEIVLQSVTHMLDVNRLAAGMS